MELNCQDQSLSAIRAELSLRHFPLYAVPTLVTKPMQNTSEVNPTARFRNRTAHNGRAHVTAIGTLISARAWNPANRGKVERRHKLHVIGSMLCSLEPSLSSTWP